MNHALLLDEPISTRAGEELNIAALQNYFGKLGLHLGEIKDVRQFPGGFSNLTYVLTTITGEFVLRRPPFGANIKSAHDMGREFKVLSLLKPHYAFIPTPICYCEDEKVIGAPFYLMQRLQGVILRAANASKMGLSADVLRYTSEILIDNLAQLHSINILQSGLIQLGKPEGYVLRQVEGWTKRYYAAETDKIGSLDEIAVWLKASLPADQTPVFLHNDYKYDNVVFDTSLEKIIGVLDWEMSTVGDPLMDLGAALAYWSEPQDVPEIKFFNLTWLPGNLSRLEAAERYANMTGRNISNLLFYYIFGLYKNAVIVQQIYARWKQGHTKDERFGKLLPVVQALGVRATEALSKNAI
ncbi:MAG: phosphotransferase family protein [Chitinophagales bacterium]|nr:phosphotransferase family protein [Chitinophagales bacterium]